MPGAFSYCDQCGRSIPPGEVANGEAVMTPSVALCGACARDMGPGKLAQLVRRGETGDSTPAGPPRSPRQPTAPPRSAARRRPAGSERRSETPSRDGSGSKVVLAVALSAGALVGVAAILLVSGSSRTTGPPPRRRAGTTPGAPGPASSERRPEPPEPVPRLDPRAEPRPPAASADTRAVSPPRAARGADSARPPDDARFRKRVDELRGLVDPSLSRLDEIRKRADALLADLGDRPEAEDVRKLVADVEARHVELAGEAVKTATAAAESYLAQGKFDDAARAFGYVRVRFGESEWFRAKGEARIAAVLRRVEEARAAYARSGLSVSDDFSGHPEGSDGSDGSPKWASRGAAVRGGALVFETGGHAHFDVGHGRLVTAETVVTPRRRTRDGWTACGLVAWKDGGAYWETGLGHGPDGKHYLWFYENFRGVWHRLQSPCGWEYGKTYRVRMELAPDGFTGRVEEMNGGGLGSIGKRFDEARRASASCRPGVFASGCEAAFDEVSAVVREAPGAERAAAAAGKAPGEKPAPTKTPAGKTTGPDGQPASAKTPAVPGEATTAAVKLPGGPKEPLPGETGLPGQWAPGLIAEIFDGHDLTRRVGVRIDPRIDYNFGPATPDLGAPADNFAVRWTGWLLVPYDGNWVFEADSDDGLSVTLDGKPLVTGKWGDAKGRSPARLCRAGLHPISAVHTENGGNAHARLRWQPAGGSMHAIPDGFFFHEVPEPGEMGPFARLVEGLWGEYYKGESFDTKIGEGPIAHPDLSYGKLPPYPGVPKDNFSVRMTGFILLYWKGTYRFDIDIDDGVRLAVAGERIVDHWGKPSRQRVSGRKELEAGYHKVVIEHMDRGSVADIKFWWVPPAYGDINDPTTYIMPKRIWFREPARRDTVDRRGLAPGMPGSFYGRVMPGGKVLMETLDPAASFSWDGSPGPGVPGDRFSAKWEGVLVAPKTGVYAFRVRHRGGIELAVARRVVARKWEDAEGWLEGSLPLRAGKTPVSLKYSNVQGKAEAKVYWSGPGFGLRKLGADALAHRAAELPVAEPWEEEPLEVAVRRADGDGRGRPGGAALVAGNQVRNGGFEETNDATKFALHWTRGQWGDRGAQQYVKTDRTNPRAGERALLVRALSEGALPGASTTLALPMGEYEVRFWAAADVESKARVHASLAGEELDAGVATEEWTQFSGRVALGEEQKRASLRLWTSTPRVRVWFDDVEVVPAWQSDTTRGQ